MATNVAEIGTDAERAYSAPFAWARLRWSTFNYRERQAVIFARDGGCCVYCGCPVRIPNARGVKSSTRAVMDHRIPVAAGGSDSMDNMVLACVPCNIRKHDGKPLGGVG